MKKFALYLLAILLGILPSLADEPTLFLQGRVKDAVHKTDLTKARVLIIGADGQASDTLACNMGRTYRSGVVDTLSIFYVSIPRIDSTYIMEVICPGYTSQTFDYRVENIGRREQFRDIPTVFLNRGPVQLNEVTVTSTKIKFYNKGDTIVYNADAFQLAEGSMLDALIAQLPGVELNDNGQIKVNGEFVESLLLNGKEFMDGNNNVMLENIGAYTVKNIQVYDAQTPTAKRQNDFTAPKVLTMDVKLKKEYSMGWIVNAQAGYGTDDRYSGRIFASWFNPTTRITAIGNINNLNDTRKPGRNDTWTPEQLPTGTKEYRMGGLDYNYESPDNSKSAQGNVMYTGTANKTVSTTAQTNFLPGSDTYDNIFGNRRDNETSVTTQHSFYNRVRNSILGISLNGSYNKRKNSGSELSGTFADEQPGMTADILEAIYSDGTPQMLQAIINRARTRTDGWTRTLSGSISPYFNFNIPHSPDNLFIGLNAGYTSEKQHDWRDYEVNYGADAVPAVRRRQYIDGTPNHTTTLGVSAGYRTSLRSAYLSVQYRFTFNDVVKDSYMYALDRLAEMGVYGVLPAGYTDVLDPANSYTSRTLSGVHSFLPSLSLNKSFNDNIFMVMLRPELSVHHRHLDYTRNDCTYKLSRTSVAVTVTSIWDAMVEYRFGAYGEGRGRNHRNSIRYSYRVSPTLPDMPDLVDITDDSNPLNIYTGNPDLRTAFTHRHLFRWSYSPSSHPLNNILYLGATHTTNDLVRGYTYDTTTGVRNNRMYNVDGNRSFAVTNELSWQFGATKQFTLSSETDLNLSRYGDMIGIDMDSPALCRVDNRNISEKLRLSWTIAGQNLSLRTDWTNRHTTSSQTGFNTINANHVVYGVSGVFKLPAGFGISTDLMCYTRRGYGSATLDTTDPVWNARLTYCPPAHTRWVFMADGFDMLHRLSNVNYAVTATGRTVSYTNTIPRYFMLSVQYRL